MNRAEPGPKCVNCWQSRYCPFLDFVFPWRGWSHGAPSGAGSRAEGAAGMAAGSSQPGAVAGGFVPPSPSNEINTFTCHKALQTQPGSFAFPCGVQPPLLSLPAQLAPCPFPIPSAERSLSAPLPGTPVTLFTKDRIAVEVQNLVVLGHGAGLCPPCVAGSGDELGAWLECWSGTRRQVQQRGGHYCRDTPRTPHSSHCGIPTVHHCSLAELEPLCPRDPSRTFPKTPSSLFL